MRPLTRLLPYLRPYRVQVLVGTLCLLLSIPCQLFHPLVWKFVVDDVVMAKQLALLWPALAVMLGVHVLGTVLTLIRTYFLGKAGEAFIFDLRHAVYEKLQRQGLAYFHQRRAGDLVSRAVNDVEAVRDAVVGGIDEIFSSLLSFVFVAGIIVYLQWVVGLLTLVPLLFVGVLMYVFNDRVKSLYRRIRDRLGDVTAQLGESISGIQVTKAFSRERHERERFREVGQGYFADSMKGVVVRAIYMPSVMVVGFFSNIVMVGLGGYFVLKGQFSLGGLVAYRGYWWQLFSPVMSLARINEIWLRANAASSRILEILDEPLSVQDRSDAIDLERVTGRLEFEHVSFHYDPAKPALTDISLAVDAGESIGVVGPSGSGKSTLLSLLLRFYDPTAGAIRIDGRDLREIRQESLRSHFGVVTQDAFLFHESVRENIRYGRLGATDAEVERAAEQANAHEFIVGLPQGYDSLVGERGVKLSGGQRQRICVARAFLANPSILLLDEATAAVEPESELLIQTALTRLMQGRTTIVVSHRLSMVRDAKIIFVIRDGLLAEQGNHAELIRKDGWYARMYRLQMEGDPGAALSNGSAAL